MSRGKPLLDIQCVKGEPSHQSNGADSTFKTWHKIFIPTSQIHRIHAELDPEQAAEDYSRELATIPCLDLILFGMGEDGHTCSLFPGNAALSDNRLAIPVPHSPKPPSERVSLGYTAIHAARTRIMMITDEGKRGIFERIRQGESFPIVIPDSERHSTL